MKLFTYMDHLAGTCKAHEIDMPWESRWTPSDVSLGLCDAEMVGQPKQSGDQQQLPDQQSVPATVKEAAIARGIDQADPIKMGFLALEVLGADDFAKRSPSVYNALIAIQKERDAAAGRDGYQIATMAASRMRGMWNIDLWMQVLTAIQEEAGEEAFLRILHRLGADPETILEMAASGELLGE